MALDVDSMVNRFFNKQPLGEDLSDKQKSESRRLTKDMFSSIIEEIKANGEIIVVDGAVGKPTPPQGGSLPVLPTTKIGTIK